MANERTYPCLPCGDIDEAIAFYEALGFTRKYRQKAPNPYGVMMRGEDFQIHLFGMPDFDPAKSYGTAIVVVPDVDELYESFAAGLRRAYGKLPTVGFPRMTRPRKQLGTVRSFSVVDVGGNWLRISRLGDKEDKDVAKQPNSLAKVLSVAARLGEAHGDETWALKTLEKGLKQFPDAPLLDYARAMLYRAELAVRVRDLVLAQSSLSAVLTLKLTGEEKALIARELAQTTKLVEEAQEST
jgi:hypothetical protein